MAVKAEARQASEAREKQAEARGAAEAEPRRLALELEPLRAGMKRGGPSGVVNTWGSALAFLPCSVSFRDRRVDQGRKED